MTTLNKINVKGKEYSLDGVKVAEVQAEIIEDANYVDFLLEDKINFYKPIRIDLFLKDQLKDQFYVRFSPYVDVDESVITFVEATFDGQVMNMNMASNYGLVYVGMYYTDTENYFGIAFDYNLYGDTLDGTETFTAKIYYHEADETTPAVEYEY